MIEKLKKMNKKAIRNGDIPVSCIITRKKEIIAEEYNKKYYKNDPLGHAEILAIRKAAKILKTSNLMDCELYTTLKPCKMCREIIRESRIKKVYYILENEKENNSKIDFIKINVEDKEFTEELKKFFKNKR